MPRDVNITVTVDDGINNEALASYLTDRPGVHGIVINDEDGPIGIERIGSPVRSLEQTHARKKAKKKRAGNAKAKAKRADRLAHEEAVAKEED